MSDYDVQKKIVLKELQEWEEAFLGDPDDFLRCARDLMKNAESFDGVVLRGAPHNYLGSDAAVGEKIVAWLKSRFS